MNKKRLTALVSLAIIVTLMVGVFIVLSSRGGTEKKRTENSLPKKERENQSAVGDTSKKNDEHPEEIKAVTDASALKEK